MREGTDVMTERKDGVKLHEAILRLMGVPNSMTQSEFEKWFSTECHFRNQEVEEKVKKIRKERNRERLNRELKPCPFCGGKAEIVNDEKSDGYCHYEVIKVECQSCMASTESRISDGYYEQYCSDEEIAELWNKEL